MSAGMTSRRRWVGKPGSCVSLGGLKIPPPPVPGMPGLLLLRTADQCSHQLCKNIGVCHKRVCALPSKYDCSNVCALSHQNLTQSGEARATEPYQAYPAGQPFGTFPASVDIFRQGCSAAQKRDGADLWEPPDPGHSGLRPSKHQASVEKVLCLVAVCQKGTGAKVDKSITWNYTSCIDDCSVAPFCHVGFSWCPTKEGKRLMYCSMAIASQWNLCLGISLEPPPKGVSFNWLWVNLEIAWRLFVPGQ